VATAGIDRERAGARVVDEIAVLDAGGRLTPVEAAVVSI